MGNYESKAERESSERNVKVVNSYSGAKTADIIIDNIIITDDTANVIKINDDIIKVDGSGSITDNTCNVIETDNNVIGTCNSVIETDNNVIEIDANAIETDNNVIETCNSVIETDNNVIGTDDSVIEKYDNVIETDDSVIGTYDTAIETDDSVIKIDDSVITTCDGVITINDTGHGVTLNKNDTSKMLGYADNNNKTDNKTKICGQQENNVQNDITETSFFVDCLVSLKNNDKENDKKNENERADKENIIIQNNATTTASCNEEERVKNVNINVDYSDNKNRADTISGQDNLCKEEKCVTEYDNNSDNKDNTGDKGNAEVKTGTVIAKIDEKKFDSDEKHGEAEDDRSFQDAGYDKDSFRNIIKNPDITGVGSLNNKDSGLATEQSVEPCGGICYYKAKCLNKNGESMSHKIKVKVDESEPTWYEEAPFERRDVVIKKDKWVTDLYTVDSVLGRGKFGEVKKCLERRTGRQLAAKFIEVSGPQDRSDIMNEVEIMQHLQHPRLLQLYDAFEDNGRFCLVMELVNGGELFERVISDDFILTEKACVMFMRQICDGVAFMHAENILHLDMKPENILCLTREGNRIKIIDFGLARKYNPNDDLRVLFGTPEFVAPEVVNFDPICPLTDMWSVGVICYVLLSGLSPFMGESEIETLSNVTMARWDFRAEEFDNISAEAKDFIAKLLVKEPRKRMPASKSLEHPWLSFSEKKEGRLPERSLSKKRLKKFVYRRKWQKAINAMLALRRMGVSLC